MKLEEVLPALREGRKIRRTCWNKGVYLKIGSKREILCMPPEGKGRRATLCSLDVHAINWEIVSEPKKHVRWLNLDKDGFCGVFNSKEQAEEFVHSDRIECRRIEWEAGE